MAIMTRNPIVEKDLSQKQVDELYGLEPVLEPDAESGSGSEPVASVTIDCPYCGESFATVVDLSAGSSRYIEDCQVCCQPIDVQVSVDEDGGLRELEARRSD